MSKIAIKFLLTESISSLLINVQYTSAIVKADELLVHVFP